MSLPSELEKKKYVEVTAADLPLHCPLPSQAVWNKHPRVYLPVEAYELLGRATVVRAAILLGNTAIVVYLLYVRWSAAERERRPMPLNRTVGP